MKNNLKKSQLSISSAKGVFSELYQDIYFDKENGINESKHVYLNSNNLEKKFKDANEYLIAELGFGTGLNFLLSWDLWNKCQKKNSSLTYISFENAPLSIDELKKIHTHFMNLFSLSKVLLKKMPQVLQSTHRIYLELGNVNLILIYDNFSSLKNFNFVADTWFLDAFSPKKNIDAWNKELFEEVYNHTKIGGSLSTYTVAGYIRRGISKSGFKVSKIKGVGNKKEILFAFKEYEQTSLKNKLSKDKNNVGPVAVIGAGISGASLIYALQKRNIECYLIDKSSTIASGASGNKVALQIPKLTLDDSPYGFLSLEAFCFSRKLAFDLGATPITDGVILLPSRDREIKKFNLLLKNNWPKTFIDNKIANFNFLEKIQYLYMKTSGLVENIKFINNLTKNVKFIKNFNVNKVINCDNGFKKIIDNKGNELLAKSVIWANGYEMSDLHEKIPIIPVSGQVTYLPETFETSKIKLNFSYGHFLSQSVNGYHQLGSSFNRFISKDFNNQDQIDNIKSIPEFLKNIFKTNDQTNFQSRTSIRASTKDRIPFYGPLSKVNGNNSDQTYVLGGMGAWGFVYAPYFAELLIKSINKEPIIINKKLERLLTLDRFL